MEEDDNMNQEIKNMDTSQLLKRIGEIISHLKVYHSPYFPCNHFEIVEGRSFEDYERDYKIKYHYRVKYDLK